MSAETAPAYAQCVLDARAQLGECPVWSVREQVLYWVDIAAQRLHRFDPASGADRHVQMDESIGCIGLRRRGGFIAGMRSGIWLLDEQARKVSCVRGSELDGSVARFNDGRCDQRGRFWAGTLREARDQPLAALYRVTAISDAGGAACEPACSLMAGDIMVSNGLGFSPPGDTLYQSDTPAHVLYAYDLSLSDGRLGPRRVVRHFDRKQEGKPYRGRPDGAAVDAMGRYWSAQYEGGRVACIAVTRTDAPIVDEVIVPARRVTMCAFGGADLRTLYITTARQGATDTELAVEPLAGGVFAMHMSVPGLPEPLFEE